MCHARQGEKKVKTNEAQFSPEQTLMIKPVQPDKKELLEKVEGEPPSQNKVPSRDFIVLRTCLPRRLSSASRSL